MAKCNDCWCEHYDKNRGNCDQCLKSESTKDKLDLNALLKRRLIGQIEIDKKIKANGQNR